VFSAFVLTVWIVAASPWRWLTETGLLLLLLLLPAAQPPPKQQPKEKRTQHKNRESQ
jgi:hypothetical protein